MKRASGRRWLFNPAQEEAIQLLAEASVVTPPCVVDVRDEFVKQVTDWFYDNSERIVLELFVHPDNNQYGTCGSHMSLLSNHCETGVFLSSIEGDRISACSEEETVEHVFSALSSLLCHHVSHADAVLLDAVLLRSALLAGSGSDCFALVCIWTLLLVRCSPHTQSRTEFIDYLSLISRGPRANQRLIMSMTLKQLVKLRNHWKRCYEHDSPFRRVVSLDDEEHRCGCGSGWSDESVTGLEGPSSTMFFSECKLAEGYCGYFVIPDDVPNSTKRKTLRQAICESQARRKRRRRAAGFGPEVT